MEMGSQAHSIFARQEFCPTPPQKKILRFCGLRRWKLRLIYKTCFGTRYGLAQ